MQGLPVLRVLAVLAVLAMLMFERPPACQQRPTCTLFASQV